MTNRKLVFTPPKNGVMKVTENKHYTKMTIMKMKTYYQVVKIENNYNAIR